MDGISLDTALLFKYFRGLTTGEERKRVEDWMQISEENEKTVLQAARIFYISQTSERILSRNSIEAYKKVQKRIDKRKKKIRLYEISIVAACFVGLLVISTAISFLLRKSSVLAPQQITVCANRGVRTSLDLPDGSIAYLNSGSTLSYPSSYDANVDVESEIAWKEGRLVFKETPLPEVLRCLANFYNVDFNVMDPVLDSYRFTGTFNNRQLSQILDYLRISSRIDYSIKRMEMDDSLSAQREQIVLRRIK